MWTKTRRQPRSSRASFALRYNALLEAMRLLIPFERSLVQHKRYLSELNVKFSLF